MQSSMCDSQFFGGLARQNAGRKKSMLQLYTTEVNGSTVSLQLAG